MTYAITFAYLAAFLMAIGVLFVALAILSKAGLSKDADGNS